MSEKDIADLDKRRANSRLTPHSPDYPSCEETYVTLRIYPGSSSSDDVTKVLGIVPSRAQDKGKPFKTTAGRIKPEAPLTAWFLTSEGEVDSKDLRDHLDWLLEKLSGSALGLLSLQEEEGTKISTSCSWVSTGEGGPALWPEQMEALAQLNLECAIEFYYFGGEDWEIED